MEWRELAIRISTWDKEASDMLYIDDKMCPKAHITQLAVYQMISSREWVHDHKE